MFCLFIKKHFYSFKVLKNQAIQQSKYLNQSYKIGCVAILKKDVLLTYLNMMFNTFLSLPNRKDAYRILN